jgi:hypothetical protein
MERTAIVKVVYVAGPYRSGTVRGIVENIRRAEALAIRVWKLGAAAICPHLNTRLFDGECPDETWLTGDFEIIRRVDALVLVDGWQRSTGTAQEIKLAKELGLPVFEDVHDLRKWIEG